MCWISGFQDSLLQVQSLPDITPQQWADEETATAVIDDTMFWLDYVAFCQTSQPIDIEEQPDDNPTSDY
jgi:hypothetical protein